MHYCGNVSSKEVSKKYIAIYIYIYVTICDTSKSENRKKQKMKDLNNNLKSVETGQTASKVQTVPPKTGTHLVSPPSPRVVLVPHSTLHKRQTPTRRRCCKCTTTHLHLRAFCRRSTFPPWRTSGQLSSAPSSKSKSPPQGWRPPSSLPRPSLPRRLLSRPSPWNSSS